MPKRRTPSPVEERIFSVSETAEISGIPAHVLRIWELRYRWPLPLRKSNGYRGYPESLVNKLSLVASLIQSGRSIGDILRDQSINIESQTPPAPTKPKPAPADFSHIPQPSTPQGQRIRQDIELALAANDSGAIARLQAESLRLRPSDRELACAALLRIRESSHGH